MKIYEVMVFVNKSGYDVRCRNDIDSKPGFHREIDENGNPTGVIENEIFETGEIRKGYIVYSGPESKAKNFANLLKFGYMGNHVARYFPTQCTSSSHVPSNFDKYRVKVRDLKISENVARPLEQSAIDAYFTNLKGVK